MRARCYRLEKEVTAICFLQNQNLIAYALKGEGVVIHPIDTNNPQSARISSLSWRESVIWGIYEHIYSYQGRLLIRGFFLVHQNGVTWVKHDGDYKRLDSIAMSAFRSGAIQTQNPEDNPMELENMKI